MIKTIQAGRALAAFAVFTGHLEMLMSKGKYGGSFLFDHWTLVGGLGVDFFFVLSGFIICFAHTSDIGQPDRAARYAWRRFSRVYPIYWLYTIGFMVLSAAGIGSTYFSTAPIDMLSYFSLIHITAAWAPLGVAWTLFYEVGFYILFATLILNRRIGIGVMALWLILILAHFADPYGGKRSLIGDALSWMNLNFFLGMAAYAVYAKGIERLPKTVGIAGLALLILAAWFSRNGAFQTFPWSRLVAGISFAMLIYSAITLEKQGKITVPKPLEFLGNASYTIYLAHVSLSSFYLAIATKLGLLRWMSPYAVYTIGIVVVLSAASVAYLVIERPLIALFKHRKRPDPAPAAVPAG